MDHQLIKLLQPLKRRVINFFLRGIIEHVKYEQGVLKVQGTLRKDEVSRAVPLLLPYGFMGVPLNSAEMFNLSLAGDRSSMLSLVAYDRRHMKQWAQGEVGLYTDQGDFIHLKRDNINEINTSKEVVINAATKVTLNTPLTELSGDLKVNGKAEVVGDISDRLGNGGSTVNQLRNTYNSHTHVENDNGGPTNAPNQTV